MPRMAPRERAHMQVHHAALSLASCYEFLLSVELHGANGRVRSRTVRRLKVEAVRSGLQFIDRELEPDGQHRTPFVYVGRRIDVVPYEDRLTRLHVHDPERQPEGWRIWIGQLWIVDLGIKSDPFG